MIDIRLLGPVELWGADGSRYELGPPQQRCVLAVLATTPGRPVAVETLIGHIWHHEPSEGVRDLLYSYISRLRRAMKEAGAGNGAPVLRRDNGGYVLDIAPDDVDLHRARALASRAMAQHEQPGGAESAVELLREAAALWRGTPLAGLKGQWAERVRAGLQQELVTLHTERYDIELRLGRHAESVAGLSALVVEHPLAEPLTGQLMLALYRSGRQADALASYARTRGHLVEEIGEEPGPALRRLHEQILRQDPVLDQRPAASIRPPADHPPAAQLSVRPAQLPPDVAGFTGRGGYLDRLDRMLPDEGEGPAEAVAVSAIVGTAGVGKTTLAVHWAHRVAGRFPDGQLYVNLQGFDAAGKSMEPGEVLRGFLEALQVPDGQIPAGTDARSGLFRSLLAGRRVLVVLDNARDIDQIQPLLPGDPGCVAVITSRHQLPGLVATIGAGQLTLESFTPDEAQRMLAGRLGPRRLNGQQQAVTEIVDRCVRLPLALAIVAARAAARPGFPLAALAAQLREAGEYDLASDIRAVFSWSYRILSPDAARLFRFVGLHPGPDLATGAAASLAGLTRARARTLLSKLARSNLLTEHAPGRFTLHDLLRDYAAQLARDQDPALRRRAAVHRVLDHYLHSAHAACLAMWADRERLEDLDPAQPHATPEGFSGSGQALDWFAKERRTLIAAVDLAVRTGFPGHAVRLGTRLTNYLDRQGHWHEDALLQQTVVSAARLAGDGPKLARALCNQARSSFRLGHLQQTQQRLRDALELFRKHDDTDGQADVMHYLSYTYELTGKLTESLRHAAFSLTLYQTTGNRRGQGRELNSIGWLYSLLGDQERCLSYCHEALALQESSGDWFGTAITWDSVGLAHHNLGNWQQAVECYQRALDLLKSPEAADPLLVATTYTRLGDTHESAGDKTAAHAAWERSLHILEELRHPAAEEPRARLRGDS